MSRKEIYIRAAATIAPQNSGEPDYARLIDPKLIRRMSRIIRMGVGAAVGCLREAGVERPDAIVTGTGYGCLGDTGIFLSRMVEQQEEMLPPTAFIQSTHNTVGGQIALMLQCHGYNNTFVHRGASFESALLDGMMLLQDIAAGEGEAGSGLEGSEPAGSAGKLRNVLVGGMDEITEISHAILSRFGLYRNTTAGEGAAFFLLTDRPSGMEWARLEGMDTFYKPEDVQEIEERIGAFLKSRSIVAEDIDLVMLGNNGDPAGDHVYERLKQSVFSGRAVMPFKDRCGEYPVASSFALWLAVDLVRGGVGPKRVLMYNHYLGIYHSLILVSCC